MVSKKEAERQARKLRKKPFAKKRTINVVRLSKTTWGVRLSPKGKRDRFDWRTQSSRGGTRFKKRVPKKFRLGP